MSKTNFNPLSSKAKKSFAFSSPGVIVSSSHVAFGLFPSAPLIKRFTFPHFSPIIFFASSISFLSRQSHLIAVAFFPISAAYSDARSLFVSKRATLAPHSASTRANSLQITPPAPVIAATLSVKSTLNGNFIFSPFSLIRTGR